MRSVTPAVVGQDTFNAHAASPKPAHRPAQDLDCCVGSFVVVDLGVGHPRMVVDHGVYEGMTEVGIVGATACDPIGGASFLLPERVPRTASLHRRECCLAF
jgi:hypothetical protein